MELFVHLDPEDAPQKLVCFEVRIPNSVLILEKAAHELPANWRAYPAPQALQEIGSQWVLGQESAVLAVPSVVVPHERNFLLNPAHGDFQKLVIRPPEPFSFEPRMWKA